LKVFILFIWNDNALDAPFFFTSLKKQNNPGGCYRKLLLISGSFDGLLWKLLNWERLMNGKMVIMNEVSWVHNEDLHNGLEELRVPSPLGCGGWGNGRQDGRGGTHRNAPDVALAPFPLPVKAGRGPSSKGFALHSILHSKITSSNRNAADSLGSHHK
jgi:hypothetical protein